MQHDCNYCGQTFCGSCTVKVKRAVLGATCMQAKISSPDIIDLICPLYSSCSFRGISESVFRLQKQTRWAKARPKFNSCIVIIFSSFFFRKKKKHVYFSKLLFKEHHRSNKSCCHGNNLWILSLLPEGRRYWSQYPCPNWFLLLVEKDDVVVVIPR